MHLHSREAEPDPGWSAMVVIAFLFLWSMHAGPAQRREAVRWPLTLTTAWLVPSLKFLMRAIPLHW